MIRSLYTAVSGMISLEAKQDVISSNMANVNTNGYKEDELVTKSFKDVMIQNRDKISGGVNVPNQIGKLNLGSRIDGTTVKFTQGATQITDKVTDFAIQGRGFFTVRHNNENYFTRDGHFRIDNSGYLVTDTGDSVLGTDLTTGATGPIYIGNASLAMDAGKNLTLDSVPKYKLLGADFNDYNKSLQKAGDNLYKGTNPTYSNNLDVQNKTLEKSNVNLTSTMIDLMTTMRSFETNQKIVKMIDESIGKAATEVGKV